MALPADYGSNRSARESVVLPSGDCNHTPHCEARDLADPSGHPILSGMTISPDMSPTAVWTILAALPRGYFTVRYAGRRYGVTNTAYANGQSFKLYAEELGGADRISLNIYRPPSGTEPALKPCEMPLDKVTAFVTGALVEAPASPPRQ